MKAWTTLGNGIDSLTLKDLSDPQPQAHEVVVRIKAAALNYRDLLVVKGVEGWKPLTERIPVSDGVGEVIALGENVSRFQLGDRVIGIFLPKWLDGELTADKYVQPLGGPTANGILAETVVFSEQALVKAPESLTDIKASTLPVAGLTAWHAIARRSRVQAGETVLFQGTGGVSLFAIQLVHALGGKAIVTSSSDAKLSKVKSLGAEETINYRSHSEWEQKVLELTEGRGVDHVIEVVGGGNLNRSLQTVKISGTISFIGLLAGLSAPIQTYQFVNKNVQIHGIETGSREMLEELIHFVGSKQIEPIIDKTFPFEKAPEALRYLESARHFGKIVLTLTNDDGQVG